MSEADMLISQITRLESRLDAVQADLSMTMALYTAAQRRVEVAEARSATAARLLRESSKLSVSGETLQEIVEFLASAE